MAVCGVKAASLTSLESLVAYRNRADLINDFGAGGIMGKSKKGPSKNGGPADQPKVDWKALDVVHPHAAGIDIGGSEHGWPLVQKRMGGRSGAWVVLPRM
jgi:hypothetical protein